MILENEFDIFTVDGIRLNKLNNLISEKYVLSFKNEPVIFEI